MSDDIYLKTTGLQQDLEPVNGLCESSTPFVDHNYEKRKAALGRAHEIRQFEIELYWKRATYFWVLQGAVFTALALTWRYSSPALSPLIPVALAALGCVTAFAGYLSARGSKFWQENWEHHIDMLEDDFEGRLHKTAYVGKDGIAWSVSGVNDRLGFCFFLFWIAVLASAIFSINSVWFACLPAVLFTKGFQIVVIVLATISACVFLYTRKTSFKDAEGVAYSKEVSPDSATGENHADQVRTIEELAVTRKPFLIRREPKI